MFIKNDSDHDLEYRNNGMVVVLVSRDITEVDDSLVDYDHLKDCFGNHIYKVESKEPIEVIPEDSNDLVIKELEETVEELRYKIEQESICHNDECKINKIEELEKKVECLIQIKEEQEEIILKCNEEQEVLLNKIECLELELAKTAELVVAITEEEKDQINEDIKDTGLSIDESKVKVVKEVEEVTKKSKKAKSK